MPMNRAAKAKGEGGQVDELRFILQADPSILVGHRQELWIIATIPNAGRVC